MEINLLELQDISKTFPGVKALDNVSFGVKKGTVHALVGENGAGKSTLIKILCGVYPHGTYSGKVFFDGKEAQYRTIHEVEEAGIACIHQELNLVPELSVGENIFLNHKPTKLGLIDFDELYEKTRQLLLKVGLNSQGKENISPYEKIKNLGIGQQQLVEIAKALSLNVKLLILDEPTSALTEEEVDILLKLIDGLRNEGVTSIYISHRLDEIMTIADEITVLRDGTYVTTKPISDITKDSMISLMVGREMQKMFPREPHERRELAFEIQGYSLVHPEIEGKMLFNDINIKAYRGEILGISGLMGAGRTELFTSIYGAYKKRATGKVLMDGKEIHNHSPYDALNNGIVLLSEDRKKYGLNLTKSVKENMTLASLNYFAKYGFIKKNEEEKTTIDYVNKLKVKTPNIDMAVGNLSGGNQQKVVIGKSLLVNPKVVVLDEPTRGIDVGAKYEIYKIMNQLVDDGVVVIMISSEMEEILGMSDRIIVMSEGEITGDFDISECSQEVLMRAATGRSMENEA